jgi:hypothetical protein
VTIHRGGERDLRWEGVPNPDLFLSCSCEMNMSVFHKKKHRLMANLYCRASKKKVIVETTDYTKRARKLFKRPPQMSKVRNHNSRIVKPTERNSIVQCGIHIVAIRGLR